MAESETAVSPPMWLPEPPPRELDPALDAVCACIARNGIRRTTMTDVANEMGVSRPTVYRQIGSVDRAIWLIVSRDIVRFFIEVREHEIMGDPAQATIQIMAAFVAGLREHPVGGRLIREDPEFLGHLLTNEPSAWFDEACKVTVPYLDLAISSGLLRQQDSTTLAQFLIRMCFVLAVAPPADTEAMLNQMLLPALLPSA